MLSGKSSVRVHILSTSKVLFVEVVEFVLQVQTSWVRVLFPFGIFEVLAQDGRWRCKYVCTKSSKVKFFFTFPSTV